jgi:iron uptake system component EfeO
MNVSGRRSRRSAAVGSESVGLRAMATPAVRFGAVSLAGLAAISLVTACSSGKSSSAGASSTAASGATSSAAGDPHTAVVTITADKCITDQASYAAGGLTFKVSNKDATGVTEIELLSGDRILGEKENLPPGFSGTFSVNADPGEYTLYCPGATTERVAFKVTGTATSAPATTAHDLLIQGTKDYGTYIDSQVALLIDAVKPLATALQGTDLTAAQVAYAKARPYYERVEPVAESFTSGDVDLDAAIDARSGDVPAAQWTGFHKIEQGLFEAKSLTGLAALGTGLLANVQKLQTLTKGLTYKPSELANGAVELLDEVAKSKITGEEERYSHIDMLDFQANVEGSEQAFANLEPGLKLIDPALTTKITTAFTALDTLLDKYRSKTDPSGFVLFSALTAADKTTLTQALQAVSEPLSTVGSKVVNA